MAAPSGSQVCKGNIDHIQRLRRMTMTLATRWSGTTSAGGVYLRSVPYHERRSGCWTNILKLGHAATGHRAGAVRRQSLRRNRQLLSDGHRQLHQARRCAPTPNVFVCSVLFWGSRRAVSPLPHVS